MCVCGSGTVGEGRERGLRGKGRGVMGKRGGGVRGGGVMGKERRWYGPGIHLPPPPPQM